MAMKVQSLEDFSDEVNGRVRDVSLKAVFFSESDESKYKTGQQYCVRRCGISRCVICSCR